MFKDSTPSMNEFNVITPKTNHYITVSNRSYHQKPATTLYSCFGVITDRSIFSLNKSRIQIPTGTSVTNCNQKCGLMLACRHVHVRLELTYFAGKISKNSLVCKSAVALAYYGSCRVLVMGSWSQMITSSC